jgi:hypothetical protein
MKEQTKNELLSVLEVFFIAVLVVAGASLINYGVDAGAFYIVVGSLNIVCAVYRGYLFYKSWKERMETYQSKNNKLL